MKACIHCGTTKDLNCFGINNANKDKLQSWCRDCLGRRTRELKQVHKDDRLAQRRMRYYMNADKERARTQKWKEENPQTHLEVSRRCKEKKKRLGLCQRCTLPRVANAFCRRHWVYNIVNALIGRTFPERTDLRHTLVEGLLVAITDPLYCPYTGELLIPGENMSLDHKTPIKHDKSLALELSNLQWVSWTYNLAKHDQTNEEFNRHWRLTYIP